MHQECDKDAAHKTVTALEKAREEIKEKTDKRKDDDKKKPPTQQRPVAGWGWVSYWAPWQQRPPHRTTKGCFAKGGGEGGIRTHGTVARTAVFKTAALNHSATCPSLAASGESAICH